MLGKYEFYTNNKIINLQSVIENITVNSKIIFGL